MVMVIWSRWPACGHGRNNHAQTLRVWVQTLCGYGKVLESAIMSVFTCCLSNPLAFFLHLSSKLIHQLSKETSVQYNFFCVLTIESRTLIYFLAFYLISVIFVNTYSVPGVTLVKQIMCVSDIIETSPTIFFLFFCKWQYSIGIYKKTYLSHSFPVFGFIICTQVIIMLMFALHPTLLPLENIQTPTAHPLLFDVQPNSSFLF